jgi:hypothetical protein
LYEERTAIPVYKKIGNDETENYEIGGIFPWQE